MNRRTLIMKIAAFPALLVCAVRNSLGHPRKTQADELAKYLGLDRDGIVLVMRYEEVCIPFKLDLVGVQDILTSRRRLHDLMHQVTDGPEALISYRRKMFPYDEFPTLSCRVPIHPSNVLSEGRT